MLFSSYEFIVFFLPVVLGAYLVLTRSRYPLLALNLLALASLFFYGWWKPDYLVILIASMVVNYGCGVWIYRTHPRPRLSKLILTVGIAFNLGLLGYFKYAGFIADNVNTLAGDNLLSVGEITLPLAISFFTFQQIAYLVDTYQTRVHEYNFSQYVLFVSFFPQLIAGPIVHHKEMMPQFKFHETHLVKLDDINIGLAIFCIGLFKKVVVADTVSIYAVPVFTAAESGAHLTLFEAWGGAMAYTLQLYYDFSGYSDMAIGLARLFGIRLPENFNSPYQARSIIDFWHRWHMTLSRFLRDYLYIPLGGSRRGKVRRYANLMVTMLLGGLWHGAGWTFVIWGGLHGLYLVVNHLWIALKARLPVVSGPPASGFSFLSWLLTFLAVVVGWVFFRAETFQGAYAVLRGMAGVNGAVLDDRLAFLAPIVGSHVTFSGVGIGAFGDLWGAVFIVILLPITFLAPNTLQLVGPNKRHPSIQSSRTAAITWSVLLSVAFAVSMARMTTVNQFLYFNF
ncbi:MAG: MBOAT family protein [Chromatiaceae bacterium]|nr:MBOAT family protein [Chromatiaceae bacterium]MCP5422328.1 MBOAT family protein [Chromatiaceae bacterium]